MKKIFFLFSICFPLIAQERSTEMEKEILMEIQEKNTEFFRQSGEFQFRVSRNNFNSYYFPNVFKIKSQNYVYLDFRPDLYFQFNPKIEGIIKPRIIAGLETEDRREKQIFYENIVQLGLYEAYFNSIISTNQKLRIGYIDLTRGLGKIFNPGNLWQSENQTANPFLENPSKLSIEYLWGIYKIFSIRGIIDFDYTNENFRIVSTQSPSMEKQKSQVQLDTTNLYESAKRKFEEELQQKFDFEKNTELIFDGTRYEREKTLDKIDHPFFLGGEMIIDTESWELRISGKYSNRIEPQYGLIFNFFLSKEIIIYFEGNHHRGRNILIPVETGKKLRKDQNKEELIIRFANPQIDLRDSPYSYGFMLDKELKQYEFLFDNQKYTREALFGLQFSLSNFTINIEYAYDGKGYSKKEYQHYKEAIYWAAGIGIGRLENIYRNTWIYDLDDQQFKQKDLELFQTSSSLSQSIFNSVNSPQFPKRLGQHYFLFEITYTGDYQNFMIIPRCVTNLEDQSSIISVFFNYGFINSFRYFLQILYSTGKKDSEFNRFFEKSFLTGISYFW